MKKQIEIKKQQGRPVNENSVRQQKLKLINELKEQGVEIKRGRPVNSESERQKRLELKGKVKLGRKVNENSERQKRLQSLELKRNSGIEVKRGRPKMIKVEEVELG
tara:strand:+ start:398 stop:715 length:318 start_codon:yes stop_codon:yes gene_type:complete